MRTREEIEDSAYEGEGPHRQMLTLEVLLDIRELIIARPITINGNPLFSDALVAQPVSDSSSSKEG